MAYLDEVKAVLDASTVPGSSWGLTRGHLPDSSVSSERMVALLETAGEPTPGRVDVDPRGLQVLVRGESILQTSTAYEEAQAKAVEVRDTLHEYTGSSESDGTLYVGIWAEQAPFFAGWDESRRPLFSANYRAWRSRS